MAGTKVFNNWDVVVCGWYVVCTSQQISIGKARSFTICGRRVVVFRGQDQRIRALDAYCPHMGTDLGIGRVEGNRIRCYFHHWAFDQTGRCQNIPCQPEIPPQARVQSYATAENYGLIWIYPAAQSPAGVPEFDDLKGKELVIQCDQPLERRCHHHICMMNGIDAQHLQTVHRTQIQMDLDLSQDDLGRVIDFTLTGNIPLSSFREKIANRILGSSYEYSMRYVDGCVGLLTLMKKVRLMPRLYMIYAYTPIRPDRTLVRPIYMTEKRKGIFGWVLSNFLLLMTRLAYYALRDEDGQIYDNIQFNPQCLLAIDAPITHYINYVNRLEPSLWSTPDLRPESDPLDAPTLSTSLAL